MKSHFLYTFKGKFAYFSPSSHNSEGLNCVDGVGEGGLVLVEY